MPTCLNHSWIETETQCGRCSQPFCASCVVDFLGETLCGTCRDYRLYEMQYPPAPKPVHQGTGYVGLGRWLGEGWRLVSQDLGTWVVAALIGWVLVALSCGLLYLPMMAGFHMMAFRKMTYGTVEIGNVFDGFRRFVMAMGSSLLRGAVFGVVVVPLYVLLIASFVSGMMNGNSPAAPVAFIGGIVAFYAVVFILMMANELVCFYTLGLIAARNAGPIESITQSWEVVRRNVWMYLLTGFVFMMIEGASAQCYIGLLIATPVIAAARAQAFADHFGIEGWDQA